MSTLKHKRHSSRYLIQSGKLLLCFSILLLTTEANIVEDPECPCLREMTHVDTPKTPDGSCHVAKVVENIQGTWSSFCYPLSYGTSCAAHDKNLEPLCNDPNNQFDGCDEPFCFIDPSKCKFSENNTYAQSSFFPNLYYSYSTCGGTNHWESFAVSRQLQGTTLRVGIPSIYFPDHFKLGDDGNPISFDRDINAGVGDFQGIYIQLLDDIAADANFTVKYESVSAAALEEHGSAWTACVQDVGRGLLDLCIGNYWETVPRRSLSQFSTFLFSENFYLIVPLPREINSIGAQMGKLFQPFTSTLWLTIILATIGVGFSYGILSTHGNFSMKSISGKIAESIYSAIMELISGASYNEDLPISIKGVTITWAFFVLIIIAAYTANLAAFLGQSKLVHKVVSVEDCIAQNCNLCYQESQIFSRLKILYPSLERYQDVFGEAANVPPLLANGTCDIFVQSTYAWSVNKDFWGTCETMFLGNFIFDFKISWPVSDEIAAPISYWLGKKIGRGDVTKIIRSFTPTSPCANILNPPSSSSAKQIGVASMAGPLVILGAGIAFSLFYKFGGAVYQKKAVINRHSLP